MLQMNLSSLVDAIVRQELIGKRGVVVGKALYFNFDVRLSHSEERGSYHQSRGLHLLYHCKFGTYIDVFSAVTENCFAQIKDVGNWKHEVSHDSCWSNLHVFSEVYFSMAEKINGERSAKGLAKVAPRDMHQWNGFGRQGLYQWVPVDVTKDLADVRGYKKKVQL